MKIPKPKSDNHKLLLIPILVIICLLCFVFYFTSSPFDTKTYHSKLLNSMKNDSSFSDFTANLFRYEVTCNSITTAYTLHDTKKYNIPSLNPILTDFSSKDYAKDVKRGTSKQTTSILSEKLSSFSKDKLSEPEQITYELLQNHLALSNSLCNYPYYESLLGRTTGVAANLPVTLSEYPLNNSENIETYLNLLTQIPAYFDNVTAYENDRIKADMATPAFILIDTNKELSSFIKSLKTDNNCFVSTFSERVKSISDLPEKEKSKYISQNNYYVKQYIVPAYEKLYDYISNRIDKDIFSTDSISSATSNMKTDFDSPKKSTINKSQSKNLRDLPDENTSYGISAYPKGKEYYELLVKDITGSYRPISDLITLTEQAISDSLSDVLTIATANPDAYMYYCDHPVETGFHSPEGILEALSLMTRGDYPLLENNPSYKIKTVPDSLAEMLSPAFYMIPAIDDYDNNTIYINPLYTSEENGNLFTTLAHEGFPGHLYQTVYYNSTNPAPIRQILDYPGYVEGWATYVELNSFSYIDYPKYSESLPTLYRCDTIINLALSSRIDMGVNYEDWTLNDTCNYFEELGFNSYYASDIYTYVVEAPGNYLSYFIGYLEIENLKNEYKNLKMENYTETEFHKVLLDIGPGDFQTIRKHILNSDMQ